MTEYWKDDVRMLSRFFLMFALALLALGFLAGRCTAQHPVPVRWPTALPFQFHPRVQLLPGSFEYRPALIAVFQPSVADPFLVVNGLPPSPPLILRKAEFFQPIFNWQCSVNAGTRLTYASIGWTMAPFSMHIWSPTGGRVETYVHSGTRGIPMFTAAQFGIDHGVWGGACWLGSRPLVATLWFELQ